MESSYLVDQPNMKLDAFLLYGYVHRNTKHEYIPDMKYNNKKLPKNRDLFKDRLIFRSFLVYRYNSILLY